MSGALATQPHLTSQRGFRFKINRFKNRKFPFENSLILQLRIAKQSPADLTETLQ